MKRLSDASERLEGQEMFKILGKCACIKEVYNNKSKITCTIIK